MSAFYGAVGQNQTTVERNQLRWGRDEARLAKPDAAPFWEKRKRKGWVSLGRLRNYDWMHVQAARL